MSRRLVRRAERRRSTARSEQDLSLVARLLRRALRHPDCAASVRRRALEKLGLLLCQQPETQGRARRLLLRNSYQFRLSADVLCYPLMAPSECLPVPPQNLLSVTDDALPLGMLGQLQEALAPSSPFWGAHGYRCGTSPFFSYVHHLDEPPRCGFDRVLAVLHAHVCSAFPQAAYAKRAEWWAHCRPHGTGHQLHFDSDDEGRAGVRNPMVSCALYLTSDIGGPTLVTDQAIGSSRLAQRGWATLPHTNRLLMFNGKFLHGVVRVPPAPHEHEHHTPLVPRRTPPHRRARTHRSLRHCTADPRPRLCAHRRSEPTPDHPNGRLLAHHSRAHRPRSRRGASVSVCNCAAVAARLARRLRLA